MRNRQKRLWHITIIIAVAMVIVTFTPLVTPAGKYTPVFLGLPYTIWTGIIISVGLVVLTVIAAAIHDHSKDD